MILIMEDAYYLGFSLFPGIGPILFARLLKKFGDAKSAWHGSEHAVEEVLKQKLTKDFLAFRESIDLVKERKKLVQNNITLLTLANKKYPTVLRQTPHPPFLLYVKGNSDILSYPKTIGMVGTRKITDYGRRVTEMCTESLVAEQFIIVSGLAFGVDASAHLATVKNNGKTIAVLGCGVDCCTPQTNQYVYDAIIKSGGAIVSTFPPGQSATPGSFPARNAIIAGLSLAVVVTEGAADSGALITANYAKKFHRPVFAVPGPITSSLSAGANNLLKDGAIAVTKAHDILDTLGIMGHQKTLNTQRNQHISKSDNPEEQSILSILESGPLHFDEIVRRMKKDSKTIGSLLSLLELKGMIKSSADGKYFL